MGAIHGFHFQSQKVARKSNQLQGLPYRSIPPAEFIARFITDVLLRCDRNLGITV